MMPFGHIGGGILVATAAEKLVFKNPLSPTTLGIVVCLSILPDLDSIPAYIFMKWKPGQEKLDHHSYFTHTPIFYFCLSIFVWIGLGLEAAILFLLITLTHLLLDSWGTDDGIMWLWPISKKKYSLLPTELHAGGLYGMHYYMRYARQWRVSIPEFLLFLGGLISVFVFW